MRRPFKDKRPFGPIVSSDKPDINLPKLGNIGPDSSTATDVGKIVFRGSRLKFLNRDEFSNNEVQGKDIQIWTIDTSAILKRYSIEPQTNDLIYDRNFDLRAELTDAEQALVDEYRIGEENINDFGVDTGAKEVNLDYMMEDGLVANKLETQVTGGFSKDLGVSIRFSGSYTARRGIDSAPIVLFLEKNRIPARFIECEYNGNFMRQNPAIAGAADKGSKMALFPKVNENYELEDGHISRADVQIVNELDDDELESKVSPGNKIISWTRDPLDNFTGLTSEKEYFARTGSVDLDSSLLGACCYVRSSALSNDTNRFGENTSLKEKTKQLHEVVKLSMDSYANRLVVCVGDSKPSVGSEKMKRTKFRHLYDGEEFTESYDDAIPFTDPTKF